jgi:hypothetical protein
MKKKPFLILEERLKRNYIVIEIFKRRNVFSFSLSISIGNDGMGIPEDGAYHSFFEAKNAALHSVIRRPKSNFEQAILRKFKLTQNLDQLLLFDE